MTAAQPDAANPTANEEGPGNADTARTTRTASGQASSTNTPSASAPATGASTSPANADSAPPSPTITRSHVASWLRQAWTLTIRIMDGDSASPATIGTLHTPSPADGTRPEDLMLNSPPAPRHRRTKASRTPREALSAVLRAFQARGRHILRARDERRSTVQAALTAELRTDRAWGPLTPWPYVVVDPRTELARHRRTVSTSGAPPVTLPTPSSPRAGADGQGDATTHTTSTEDQQ